MILSMREVFSETAPPVRKRSRAMRMSREMEISLMSRKVVNRDWDWICCSSC
jgi:hypothetical protein